MNGIQSIILIASLTFLFITGSLIYHLYKKKSKKIFINKLTEKLNLSGAINSDNKFTGSIKDHKITVQIPNNSKEDIITIIIEYVFKDGLTFNFDRKTVYENFGILRVYNKTGKNNFKSEIFLPPGINNNIIAYLDKDTRKNILSLLYSEYEFYLSDWEIKASMPLEYKIDNAVKNIEAITQIIDGFNKEIDLKERFLNAIKTELYFIYIPNMISQYVKNYKVDNKLYALLKEMLARKIIKVTILAASYLGDEGMEHILSLLGSRDKPDDKHLIEIVHLFKNNLFLKSADRLKEIFTSGASDELKLVILNTFKDFKDEKLNDFLLACLNEADRDIKIAVIEALGTCGRLDAVEKLYITGKSSMNPLIKNSVQTAIGQIQLRHAGGERGSLSTVEIKETDGALSEAEQTQGGELSGTED